MRQQMAVRLHKLSCVCTCLHKLPVYSNHDLLTGMGALHKHP